MFRPPAVLSSVPSSDRTSPRPARLEASQLQLVVFCHAVLFFLLGRSWCRGGSEHPDSDFIGSQVSTATRQPSERRSVGMGSSPTADRSASVRYARSGTATSQTHSQRS